MLPHIQRLGLEVEGEDDLDTLTERLQAALAAVRAQVVAPSLCWHNQRDESDQAE